MPKKSFIFTKEMSELLKKIRIKAGLSQSEVADRIGLSSKTKDSYISHLEKGRLKNPALGLILLYLRACGESWPEFFKQLDIIDFKMRHEKMISQVNPPPAQRKIQRDAMRYEIGVEFPSKEKEEIDFERLKKRIKDKVTALLNKEDNTLTSVLSHQGRGGKDDLSLRVPKGDVAISRPTTDSKGLLRRSAPRTDILGKYNQGRGKVVIADYQKFALEYFEFLATLNKPGMKMITDKYQRAGLKLNILHKIKKIINSVLRGEIKRILAKKPLPTEKQERMAIGFTKYRIRIEQIEAEAHRLLCENGVPTPLFSLYKDFVRECYRAMKQHFGKMYSEPAPKIRGETLEQTLNKFIQIWVKEGLKEDILLKLKARILSVFTSMRMKGLA